VADWQGTRRDGGSLICSTGEVPHTEKSGYIVILRLDWALWAKESDKWRRPSGSWRLDGNDIAKVMWTGRLYEYNLISGRNKIRCAPVPVYLKPRFENLVRIRRPGSCNGTSKRILDGDELKWVFGRPKVQWVIAVIELCTSDAPMMWAVLKSRTGRTTNQKVRLSGWQGERGTILSFSISPILLRDSRVFF